MMISTSNRHIACATRRALVCAASAMLAACAAESAPTTAALQPERAVARIVLSPAPATITVAGTATLMATLLDATGAIIQDRAIAWSVNDSSRASVADRGAGAGFVFALKRGAITVRATSGGVSATTDLTVTAARLQVRPEAIHLVAGDSAQLTAQYFDSQGIALKDVPSITWVSNAPSIAFVAPNGVIQTTRPNAPSSSLPPTGVIVTGRADGLTVSVSVVVDPYTPGQVATVRLVQAATGLGSVTFNTNNGQSVPVSFGDVRSFDTPAGYLTVDAPGFPRGPYTFMQNYVGTATSTAPLTLYAIGGVDQTWLMPMWDVHAGVPPGKVLVRVVMASWYAPSYAGNNLFLLPANAPVAGLPLQCYFDAPTFTDYVLRDAGTFDIALVDPPGIVPDAGNVGREYVRFRGLVPAAGRATTFVITGNSSEPASLRVFAVQDP